MARPVRNRLVSNLPRMAGFKPFGQPICEVEVENIQYDEYESIKLVVYDNLSQDEAAERMRISRPTFTRVYNSALKKIARAFVEGKAMVIEGGQVEFEKEWYKCQRCHKLFEGLESHKKCQDCPAFGTEELQPINPK